MLKSAIKSLVHDAVRRRYPELEAFDSSVDEPSSGIDADLCSNAPLALARKLQSPPTEVANRIAETLASSALIRKVEISKNGFLNFILDEKTLQDFVLKVCREGDEFSQRPVDPSKPKTLLEFVSANPTGPLHIGHGRGAALGDSLARIYRRLGYPITTEYYVNDLGLQMQILADSVRARAAELKGEPGASFPENGYKGDYIADIARMMIEQKRDDFSKFPREYILDWIRRDLEAFGVSFERWFSETSLHESGRVEESLKVLESKNALKIKEGALWFTGQENLSEEEEKDKERVLKRSDGRYTYFASDVAYHRDKFERGFSQNIDIWGHDHHGYVPRVMSAVGLLGYPREGLKILLYQLVSLKRGGKRVAMSTRSGEFVTLREILDEVGRDACRFFFAMRSPNSQLEFDVDLAKKQSNENPVYYVQYVHARICSIFREAEKRGVPSGSPWSGGFGSALLVEKEERVLMKKLALFEDMLEASVHISSPHLLATYLLDAATAFHKFYDKHRVLDAAPGVREARFALLEATRTAVRTGLSLLGVSAPDKM